MVCANQNRMCAGEAGNAISLLCAGQATKNGLVVDALLSLATRWGRMKHETKRNLFRHIQIEKMSSYVRQVNWLKDNCVLKLKQKQNG